MTAARRGFSRERHGVLKALLAALAVAGFAGGWAGFAAAHDQVQPPPGEAASAAPSTTELPARSATATPPGTAAGVPPTRTVAATATAGASGDPPEPTPAPTRRPKRSRAS